MRRPESSPESTPESGPKRDKRAGGGLAVLAVLAVLGTAHPQSQRIALFNGKDLSGWVKDTAGQGTWTVAGGEIRGTKTAAQQDWGHLLSKRAIPDGYLRVRYKVDSGNSGLYVRSAIGGVYHVTGLQVEMGGKDGSMMAVTASKYTWLVEEANPAAPKGAWHELAVEIKGQSVTTWVNGKPFAQAKNIDTAQMPRQGLIAFQLHSGNYQNTLAIKEVTLFTPTLIRGCLDSAFKEFNPAGNEADPAACRTLKNPVALARGAYGLPPGLPAVHSWSGLLRLLETAGPARVYDAGGRMVYDSRAGKRPAGIPRGIHFVRFPSGPGKGSQARPGARILPVTLL